MPGEKKRAGKKQRRHEPAVAKAEARSARKTDQAVKSPVTGHSPAESSRQVTSSKKQKKPLSENHLPTEKFAYGSRTISRTSAQGLSITVQIPPLRRPKAPQDTDGARHPRKLLRPFILAPVILLIAGGIVAFMIFRPQAAGHVTMVSAAKRTEPDYHPLVPSGTQATSPSYDGTKNLVSYGTTFSGARITVSEQSLPATFAADGGALKRAADSINATTKVDTGHGLLYATTADKDTGQMALYAGTAVLVFAHADKKLDDTTWKSFVDVLQAKDWQSLGR